MANAVNSTTIANNKAQKVGELVLYYDQNLEFVDETWLLDVDSPMLEIQHTQP